MKQKITIMKQRLDLSDEEINRYMDFDSLRKKQKELNVRKRNQYTLLKWTAPAVLLISSTIVFFILRSNDGGIKSDQQTLSKSNQLIESPEESALIMDSARINHSHFEPSIERVVKPKKSEVQKLDKSDNSIEDIQAESVYIQAEPISGYPSLYAFLNSNLQYPFESLKDSIQGVQTVSFIINKEGMPENIQFVESLGSSFEIESKRLIESMPVWKPATLNGKPVTSKLVLPLTFQIQTIKAKE